MIKDTRFQIAYGKTQNLGSLTSANKLEEMVGALKTRRNEIFLILSVFLFGFLFYLWVFLRYQLVPMIDGPYYLIQVRSLLTTGGLAYGDPPLTFYLLTVFSLLFGDVSLGVKVGVSFFCALSTIPAYFLMKRVGKSVYAGLTAMLLIIFSAPYIRMLTDFMKNAIGICWLLIFLYYLHDLAFSGFKKSSLALASFFLVLSGLTHILVFGAALVFLALYSVTVVVFNVNRREFLKALSVIVLVIIVFVFVASSFFSSLFTDFNKVLAFFGDLTASQSAPSQTPVPLNPRPGLKPPPPRGSMDVFSLSVIGGWGVILLILSFGTILCLYVWRKGKKEALLLLTAATIMGSIVCFPLIPNEWLGRFMLMFVVPTAIILSYAISKIWRLNNKNSKFFAIFLLIVCLLFFVWQSAIAIGNIRPTINDTGYLDLTNMKNHIPSNSIIVVSKQHGFGYWVEYVEDAEIIGMNELTPELWQTYSHVMGVFYKREVPPVPFKTIFVGDAFLLVELQQKGNPR